MKKIKKEKLTKLQALVKSYNSHQLKLGELCVEKQQVLKSIFNVQSELEKLQAGLKEKYGDITVDINTGEISKNESS